MQRANAFPGNAKPRPQLPHRLRCTEVAVSSDFAGALRRLMQAAPTERRQSLRGFVDADSVAKHVGTGFKVPLACAELYREWVPYGTSAVVPRGALAHLSLETVARLAVDVYLDEFHAWVNRVGAHAESRTPHP